MIKIFSLARCFQSPEETSGVVISLEMEPLVEQSLSSHPHCSCAAVSPLCHAAKCAAVAARWEHSGCSEPQARVP